ncbi:MULTISPECIES: hypothetical protein [Niallia]|jgi:hypothetical protein|uniref:Uncharacterized protein n=1 Tax=Niallia circulans TaxID=1397 RepID=A0A268F9J0_NIACI|nr:hypothetical protein [Niallia circulans]AYV66796.1 hypothetical protein C2I06_07860 [Niallia circulans]AYV70349.1 hypothetical protein C2H98_01500 [Niallia circulans]NRG27226.1 hypothetical protein [Niallia circulans]PAD82009.1 hypothetical protein CHH57_16790 [Niallia circulans]QJX62691.1 hypothetical protein HLK66_14210 [Niallia circulans]
MFDPTAFENMRTVMEGLIYDKDLDGDIIVLDRNDVFNSSKLSRNYTITFRLKNQQNAKLMFELSADLQNLSAELLASVKKEKWIGATVYIHLFLRHKQDKTLYPLIQQLVEEIWGKDLKIRQEISYQPLEAEQTILNHITIDFNRLITEEQIDDMITMMEFMEKTLTALQSIDSLLTV